MPDIRYSPTEGMVLVNDPSPPRITGEIQGLINPDYLSSSITDYYAALLNLKLERREKEPITAKLKAILDLDNIEELKECIEDIILTLEE